MTRSYNLNEDQDENFNLGRSICALQFFKNSLSNLLLKCNMAAADEITIQQQKGDGRSF